MAQDRPTASEFLAAIADFLREEATPAFDRSDPRLGFQMRVAANSLYRSATALASNSTVGRSKRLPARSPTAVSLRCPGEAPTPGFTGADH